VALPLTLLLTLPLPHTVPNVGVIMIPHKSHQGLPLHQAFIALEGGGLAIDTGGDGDLLDHWELHHRTTTPPYCTTVLHLHHRAS
jgi:hypothetical protein